MLKALQVASERSLADKAALLVDLEVFWAALELATLRVVRQAQVALIRFLELLQAALQRVVRTLTPMLEHQADLRARRGVPERGT